MKVLLTGATGFIGSRVSRDLARAGQDVVCAVRSDTARDRLTARGLGVVIADIREPDTICAAARDTSAVVHLAFSPEDPGAEEALASALVAALAGTGKTLVWTSGVAVVGSSGPDVFDERAPLLLDGPVGWRARGEQIVCAAAADGVRSMVIRLPIVHADGDAAILGLFAAAARGEDAVPYPDAGDARWATVHADDVAQLYLSALDAGEAGQVYIAASEHYVLIRDLARLVSVRLGLDGRTVSVPLSDMVARTGPMAYMLASSAAFSGRRATSELGWTPSRPGLLELVGDGA